jgi:hypothetical protein
MPTLNYKDLFSFMPNQLRVPEGTENMTTLEAALAWAKNGFYVLPINKATKHAGSVVGVGWPEKSSKDSTQIHKWFAGSDYGLALHVGKSGAIAFDVDTPSAVPYRLREWMLYENVPFQSTRTHDPLRGHYLFATLQGRSYGNSTGRLGKDWGEVRGKNGIIVVAPTKHSKADQGGQYIWQRTGVLPYLPRDLEDKLPANSSISLDAVALAEVNEFFASHSEALVPEILDERLSDARTKFASGSRHDTARDLLTVCLREAMAGLYSAKESVERIAYLFSTYKPQHEWSSPHEFIGMVRWAVAQVAATDSNELKQIREGALMITSQGIQEWLGGLK